MFSYFFARNFLEPLNPKIEIKILSCQPYSFTIEVVGRSKFILCDHVLNSHNHSVLQNIAVTRRNLMLITVRV